jgi:chromate reductase, NAD(P)H dehydrogenase (quinone)
VHNDIRTLRVLAISGSLRSASSNRALVQALTRVAPDIVDVSIYDGLADVPAFNPDHDGESPAAAVSAFRSALQACDAVVISSPEYAHGVPGALKNALDWVVGSGELIEKPIALINVSPQSTFAQASLKETLTVMSAKVIPEASITLPLAGRKLDANGIAADRELSTALRSAMVSLSLGARGSRSAAS